MADGFANSIIGGAETLVRSAIKSVNYVLGLAGWRISRDGDAEFNDATIRGSLSAGGGTVVINELGIFVTDDNSTAQYVILRDGGIIARHLPNDGQYNQLWTNGLVIKMPTVSPGGFASNSTRFDASIQTVGGQEAIQAVMLAGGINGQSDANIIVQSETALGGTQPYIQLDATATGSIELTAALVSVLNRLIDSRSNMDYSPSQFFNISKAVLTTDTNLSIGATNYPIAFPVGSTIYGVANIISGAGSTAFWYARFLPVSNTQFNVILSRPATGSASTLSIDILVWVLPP